MGYYTKFDLTAQHRDTWMAVDPETEKEMAVDLWANYINSGCSWTPQTFEVVFEEEMKWYNCEHDMFEFSKKYPDYIFLLEGVGEEFDDQWRLYVCNGVMEKIRAKIIFDAPQEQLFTRMHY